MSSSKIIGIKFEYLPIKFDVDLTDDGYGREFWRSVESGNYELDTFGLVAKYAKEKRIFVDVGAANGAISIFAAKLGYRVVSIEANKDVFRVLKRNIELNGEISKQVLLENAILVSKEDLGAKGDIFENGLLTEIARSGSGVNTFKNPKLIDVESIFKDNPGAKYLLKVDIEGAEWRLFNSNSFLKALKAHDVIIILALHPGLNRPLKKDVKRKLLQHFLGKTFWRIMVIKEALYLYSKLKDFNVYRTNGSIVKDGRRFIALLIGGYHEYLIIPRTKGSRVW